MKIKPYYVLFIALLSGVGFSWFTVISDFIRFQKIYGTMFKVAGCSVPNPVTAPCFYGAIAFLISLVLLIQKKYSYLKYLLIGGTIFAWTNFIYEAIKFYLPSNTSKVGCSGIIVESIFRTPCFYGAVIYLICLLIFIKFQSGHFSNKELK